MHALLQRLDQLALRVGHASAWLSLALVLVTVSVVGLRYGLDKGSIALQETALYLHGALFMLGMSYTLAMDEHVRVDIFYRRLPPERRALVDLAGTLLLLAPLCIAMLVLSWDYVMVSWQRLEGSADAGGLPFVYLLKTLLLAMPALLLVQALAEGLRAWLRWRGETPTSLADGEGQGWN
jgi:TRAP-type mannitol/chloroaromatic compound transport system permease small subunit